MLGGNYFHLANDHIFVPEIAWVAMFISAPMYMVMYNNPGH